MRLWMYVLLVGSCVGAWPVWAQGKSVPPAVATPVVIATAKVMPLQDTIETIGTLVATEQVYITANIAHKVVAIHFTDGQRVAQNDPLLELDSREIRADLAQALSVLTEAKQQLVRAQPLVASGALAQTVLDQRERDVASAEANVAALRARLADYTIRAPFAGVVGLRMVSLGALVQPGDVITTLDADDAALYLDFSVPELFLQHVQNRQAHSGSGAQQLTAHSRAFPDHTFVGRIQTIGNRLDPTTRALPIRAILEPPPNTEAHLGVARPAGDVMAQLRPGLLMRVALATNPRQALMIPELALIPSGRTVAVLQRITTAEGTDTVARQVVAVGARRDGWVEILSGLAAGDQVVTHGTLRAKPGQPIRITAEQHANEPLTELLGE